MKRILLFATFVALATSAMAECVDSVKFVTAHREAVAMPKGAEGYTILRLNIFGSMQTISVMRYSPKRFKTAVVLPDNLSPLSVTAKSAQAAFGVNAGYWDVSNAQPSTFLVIEGRHIAQTAEFEKERVDGLVCIGKRKVVIDGCKADAEAEYKDKYSTILASGPMLIDEGRSVDHESYMRGMKQAAHGKDIGAYYTYMRRHPRTAMGTDKRGDVYLVVVDGRAKDNAEGVTIVELTKICEWLGLRDAINLDGGSSSTMWSAMEGVVSYPCRNRKFDHEGERRVSSCVLVSPK